MSWLRGPDDIHQRLRSVPIKVHWHGFESDTFKMQTAGWSISAHEDVACMMMALAFARKGDPGAVGQPNELRGITNRFEYNYHWHERSFPPDVVAEIKAVGSRIHVHDMGPATFRPVDCTPQLWGGKITSLDDMANFVPAGNVPEVIVAEPEVEELLAQILARQQPAKVARATEAMYEARKSGLLVPKVHAQIISLQDYKAA